MSEMINVEHLAYTYPGVDDTPGVAVFEDMNLSIEAGTFVAILGSNGCGKSTLAAAAGGAEVWHVDAAKNMVSWAKENAQASGLADKPIHWIVDDCAKFIQREIRRGRRYDGVIMDPPS